MGSVSTRTPEGEPARCPVCGGESLLVPSAYPTHDAPCPRCGHLLWLSGHPDREECGERPTAEPVPEAIAEMERAIQRGAELLRELQQAQPVELPPTRESAAEPTGLTLREITDPADILAIELQAR